MRSWRSHLTLAFILILASQASASLNVLMLHSYNDQLPWVQRFQAGMTSWSMQPVSIYREYMDAERLPPDAGDEFVQYLASKYQNLDIDVILIESNPMAMLAANNRSTLDLITPLRIYYTDIPLELASKEAQITPDLDRAVGKTLELATQMQPELENVVIINGPSVPDRGLRSAVERALQGRNINIDERTDFALAPLLANISELPANSAIFISLVLSDNTGATFIPRNVVKQVVEAANVPVYSMYDTFIGTGMVGGYLFDGERIAHLMLDATMDMLDDAQLSRTYQAETPIFDVQAIEALGLPVNLVPADAVLVNPPLRLVQRFPAVFETLIIVLLALVCATLLCFAWLQSHSRRLAGKNSQLNQLQTQLTKANEKLREQALRDGLTGLLNRQAMEPMLEEACQRVARYQTPISLLVIDIDDFKQVNDEFGHRVGDDVLIAVADVLASHTRESDVVARWGGEEFVVLLNNTPAQGALFVANSLCDHIEKLDLVTPVTISVGGAQLPNTGDWESAFVQADSSLYDVKGTGKNSAKVAMGKRQSKAG